MRGDSREPINVAVSVYGSRGVAEIWKMYNSPNYSPTFYAVCKQNNPMVKRLVDLTGGEMWVDRSLSMETHMKPFNKYRDKIRLVVCPHEKLVIGGWRDEIEKKGFDAKTTFPTSVFALERSKILQRQLFPDDFNPHWKAFYPSKYSTKNELEKEVTKCVKNLGGIEKTVFKPDPPATGKGVWVAGDHYDKESQLIERVHDVDYPFLIEEKVEREESSAQIWYDGNINNIKNLRYPETRDYKRAFDDDKGPNTGGQGTYMDKKKILPWMTKDDYIAGFDFTQKYIRNIEKWAYEMAYDTSGMWPCMHYNAMAHPHTVFEANTGRPGDPEDIVALMTMKNDLIDFYLRLTEGNAPRLEFEEKAAVLVYVVPPTYGGKMPTKGDITIYFDKLVDIQRKNPIYFPGDVEIRDDETMYVRSSRSVAVVATADTIEEAALVAQEGAELIELSSFPKGLWHRTDIGSKAHIEKSKIHRKKLSVI